MYRSASHFTASPISLLESLGRLMERRKTISLGTATATYLERNPASLQRCLSSAASPSGSTTFPSSRIPSGISLCPQAVGLERSRTTPRRVGPTSRPTTGTCVRRRRITRDAIGRKPKPPSRPPWGFKEREAGKAERRGFPLFPLCALSW